MKPFLSQIENVSPKYIALLFFIFSFVWMFSFTYNFPFFWEDSFYIDTDALIQQNPETYSFQNMAFLFFDILFDPQQFYTLCYNAQPCRPLLYSFFYPAEAASYGLDVLFYRIERALIFALSVFFIYFFVHILRNGNKQFILPLLGMASLIIIPEFWVMILYSTDPLPHVLLLTILIFLLFYFFYNNDALQNKLILALCFFFIILFTRISISLSHIGRINFIIFFLFLFFTNRKKIVTLRHASLLLVLFVLSIPFFSFFPFMTTEGTTETTNNTFHSPIPVFQEELTLIPYHLFSFLILLPLSFFNHAFFLFLLLIIFFCLHVYCLIKKRTPDNNTTTASLASLTLFSLFWFLLSALLIFLARGFTHPPLFFLRYQFSLFIIPQTLFVLSYSYLIYKKYFSIRKILYYLLILFLILGICSNLFLFNHWRGGWGAYLLGYDTVRHYVDDHAEHALLVLPFDHASPLYFIPPSTNHYVMVSDITNTSLLATYQQNYSAIYIANTAPLIFDSTAVINVANLTINDTSPYGLLKKIIGKGYPSPLYVYMLQQ